MLADARKDVKGRKRDRAGEQRKKTAWGDGAGAVAQPISYRVGCVRGWV